MQVRLHYEETFIPIQSLIESYLLGTRYVHGDVGYELSLLDVGLHLQANDVDNYAGLE